MVSAHTTAAVMNHSMCPPEERVSPLIFMPNHRESRAAAEAPQFDEETIERMAEYQSRVEDLACELRKQAATNG